MPWRLHVTNPSLRLFTASSFCSKARWAVWGWVGRQRQVKLVGPSFACDAPPRSGKLRGNRFFAVRTFAATCYRVGGGQRRATTYTVRWRTGLPGGSRLLRAMQGGLAGVCTVAMWVQATHPARCRSGNTGVCTDQTRAAAIQPAPPCAMSPRAPKKRTQHSGRTQYCTLLAHTGH